MNRLFTFFIILIALWSCGDDGLPDVISVPPRPLSEVALEDDAEIQEFLRTHFYNYEDFETPPADFNFEIQIDTIDADNADKIPLIDQVETRVINVSAFEFLTDGEENIPHTYYFLEARRGEGVKPTIADSTFVNYKALLLDGLVFDEIPNGTWWDNPTFQFAGPPSMRAFRGVGEGVVNFASGTEFTENDNGTIDVNDSGIGMIIFPSALGTFNGIRNPIPQFSPLIFQIEVLFAIENTDHDNDGIPSIIEDIDGDGIIVNDNSDSDLTANFQDPDDDGDGILTRDEIEIDADGNITFPDTDNDGTPDYLDSDS